MSGFRDMSVPYSAAELEELRTIFSMMKTYQPAQISSKDIPELVKAMRYERTPEQIAAYVQYWDKNCDGKVNLDEFMSQAKVVHKTHLYAMDYAKMTDKDNSGTIDGKEFKDILSLISAHDPKIFGKTYEDFVKEADVDHDGKVSITEATNWIEKHTDQ